MAIWGDLVRSLIAGPKLTLSFNKRSDFNVWLNGQGSLKTHFYHFLVENSRRWTPATKAQVLLLSIHRQDQHGQFPRDPMVSTMQFTWQFPNTPDHEKMPTLRSSRLCDLGCMPERGNFELSVYRPIPFNFHRFIEPNQIVRIVVVAEAENSVSNDLAIEIHWNGTWAENPADMDRHLKIRTILSKEWNWKKEPLGPQPKFNTAPVSPQSSSQGGL